MFLRCSHTKEEVMNKIIIFTLLTLVFLSGCQSTKEPSFIGNIQEIDQTKLKDFWVPKSNKVEVLSGRPNWLPKGAGKASYVIIIDSSGSEVSKKLVSSTPEGWMTQKLLNKMPKTKYKAANSNNLKVPVKVLVKSEVKIVG